MTQIIRMTDDPDTAAQLVATATELFARHGYHGTSVRAITRAAGVNLGAITYHFGSKGALYEAAIASIVGPSTEHLTIAADVPGSALVRIEHLVRGFFDYLTAHPEMPRILVHHLAAGLPIAAAAREAMQRNLRLMSDLIAQGQHEGSIREGNPTLMALSILAQPMFLSLMRKLLQQGLSVDQDDPQVAADLRDSVVAFVRAALARPEPS